MANNPQNIRLSACHVRWGGRDLGLTKGGVDVTIKTETKPVTVDQFGPTLVNEIIMGRTLTVKCPFAETDLDTLFALMKQSGATMSDTGTAATGTITFSAIPTAGDKVTIGGHVFTFVAATPTPGLDQVALGADVAATIANLIAVLGLSSDNVVQEALYTAGTGAMTVTYYRSGVIGNSFPISATGTGATASGATLTGGTDGVRSVTLNTGSGISMLSAALPLVLHPADKPDNDTSDDFTVFAAGQSGTVNFAYKIDAERIYTIEFSGFPSGPTNKLCKFGV